MQFRFSKALVSLSVCHTLVCVSCHRLLWVQQKLVIIARKIQKDLLKLNFVDLYCQLFGKKTLLFAISIQFPSIFSFSPGVLESISRCLEDFCPIVPRSCDVLHVVLQQSDWLVGSPWDPSQSAEGAEQCRWTWVFQSTSEKWQWVLGKKKSLIISLES